MLKKPTQTAYPRFIILGLLTSVVCNENFLVNDVDSGSLLSANSNLKQKCPEYPDLLPCHYWESLLEEAENEDKIQSNTFKLHHIDGKTANNTALSNHKAEENPNEELLIEIPLYRTIAKRFAVFRRRNPNVQGYKRGPGFRSWGGKRDSTILDDYLDKRTKFTSWGGKRDDVGSKLDELLRSEEEQLNEKRTKFVSWGGKRDYFGQFDDSLDKRSKFRSWGGKREIQDTEEITKKEEEAPISYDQLKKRKPYWTYNTLSLLEPPKKPVPKRPHFQSWGGKRTIQPWNRFLGFYYNYYTSPRNEYKKLLNGEEKRKFSSWGGKRNILKNNPGQDSYFWEEDTMNDLQKRPVFQNWGGKRTDLGEIYTKDGEPNQNVGEIFALKPYRDDSYAEKNPLDSKKRNFKVNTRNLPYETNDFNSWGGKR